MGKRRMWKISLLYWVSKGKGSENVWTDKFYCLIYLHSFRHGQRLLSSYRLKQSLSPSMCFSTSVCVCVKLLIGSWWWSLHGVSDEVWNDSRGMVRMVGVNDGGMEGEEWGQAPEVQSHQLRQLCGANAGARRWRLKMSLQRGEREKSCIPIIKYDYESVIVYNKE